MKIGILMQTDKGQPLLWQKHPEIYTRTKKRVCQMKKILIESGYEVKVFESFLSFLDDIQYNGIKFDLVFYAIESCFNRNTNGFIPSLLEINGIPFVGNDSYINTISSDKFLLDCACLFGKRNTDITSNIAKTQH